MKVTDGLFLECARRIHQHEYPNIEYEEIIIDAGCMKLVQGPGRFDVLLLENLYGDVWASGEYRLTKHPHLNPTIDRITQWLITKLTYPSFSYNKSMQRRGARYRTVRPCLPFLY